MKSRFATYRVPFLSATSPMRFPKSVSGGLRNCGDSCVPEIKVTWMEEAVFLPLLFDFIILNVGKLDKGFYFISNLFATTMTHTYTEFIFIQLAFFPSFSLLIYEWNVRKTVTIDTRS